MLDDVSSWTPSPDVTVVRPAAVPAGAALFAPYQDGMWLQASGDTEMHSFGAHREDLAPAWGRPQSVDEFATALKRAVGR